MAGPDLSEFLAASKPKKKKCQVGAAAEQLSETERAQLSAACATDLGTITTAAVRDWLAARGHVASVAAITYHRRMACACHD